MWNRVFLVVLGLTIYQFGIAVLYNKPMALKQDEEEEEKKKSSPCKTASQVDSTYREQESEADEENKCQIETQCCMTQPSPTELPLIKCPGPIQTKEEPQTKVPLTASEDLNIWIRASVPDYVPNETKLHFPIPDDSAEPNNYFWRPLPDSIWSTEKAQRTLEREHSLRQHAEAIPNRSMQDFLKLFR